MKLEKIKQLSNIDLGNELVILSGWEYFIQGQCIFRHKGKAVNAEDLCQSLDLVAEIEKLVIEKDADAYKSALAVVVGFDLQRPITPKINLITASARARSEACLLALSEGECKK